ncbi:MAG TPA: helix-turn-helix transcriptional regulator [Trebonia sp.]|nr:helix-turn-helix transcriptional regulator [Trebonia sp.]
MLTDCGRELHRLLEERRLSLREAARQAGCSPGYLSNVAHGRKSLTPRVAARLDKVLETTGTFAALAVVQPSAVSFLVPVARAGAGPADGTGGTRLAWAAAAGPDGAGGPPQIPPALPVGLSRGNAIAVVEALGEILPGYVQADRLVGSAALLLPLRSHVATVEWACEVARGHDRAGVLEFASRFMEFIGWAHQDAGDLDCAMQWASRALDYAVELGDERTIAYTLMRKASIATEAGLPGHGAGMSSAALARGDALTPRLKAVILRQRAHASAALQEPVAASRDADAAVAEAVAGVTQDEEDRAPYCSPVYAAMEAGAVHLRLGDAATALSVLEPSCSQWSDTSQARDHALSLARLAEAYAALGERDQARAAAEDALTAAAGLASRRVTGELAGLASKLAPWADDSGTAAVLRKLAPVAQAQVPAGTRGGSS